jgi:5'-nucleotidase
MKKILFIDMDGVLANFNKAADDWLESHPTIRHIYQDRKDRIHGIFRDIPPIDGAIDSVKKLAESGKYDMFIATAAPWDNPDSATDKRYWIERHFGDLFKKRMFVTHRKDLLSGDYLIDDRTANGAGEFKGELLLFGGNDYRDWNSILQKLL